MDEYGGRPHWGKRHFQTAETLRPRYPRWDASRPCARGWTRTGASPTPTPTACWGPLVAGSNRRASAALRGANSITEEGSERRPRPRAVVLARTSPDYPSKTDDNPDWVRAPARRRTRPRPNRRHRPFPRCGSKRRAAPESARGDREPGYRAPTAAGTSRATASSASAATSATWSTCSRVITSGGEKASPSPRGRSRTPRSRIAANSRAGRSGASVSASPAKAIAPRAPIQVRICSPRRQRNRQTLCHPLDEEYQRRSFGPTIGIHTGSATFNRPSIGRGSATGWVRKTGIRHRSW